MPFTVSKTSIDGLLVIKPLVFHDERGHFMETYKRSDFIKAGINDVFVQDNCSRSNRGILRGLHFQRAPYSQAKLVSVTRGRIWSVSIDLRPDSMTYGRWHGLELSEENRLMFFIPVDFAHGFVALEDGTELQYKCSAEYSIESEGGIRWDDPDLGIVWPFTDVLVSPKDAALPYLYDAMTKI